MIISDMSKYDSARENAKQYALAYVEALKQVRVPALLATLATICQVLTLMGSNCKDLRVQCVRSNAQVQNVQALEAEGYGMLQAFLSGSSLPPDIVKEWQSGGQQQQHGASTRTESLEEGLLTLLQACSHKRSASTPPQLQTYRSCMRSRVVQDSEKQCRIRHTCGEWI
jgi:hypothetical protein